MRIILCMLLTIFVLSISSCDENPVAPIIIMDTTIVVDTTILYDTTIVVDTTVIDTTIIDTTIIDTTVIDTTIIDTTIIDTTIIDTTVIDTTIIDTTVIDTTIIDTTVIDTTIIDTTIVIDTTIIDTTIIDTTIIDTTIIDTTIIDSCIHMTADYTFIHISHTRGNKNPQIIEQLKKLHFDAYDYRLLGGDITYATSKDDATLTAMNTIFGFNKETTLWALGNHDYYNPLKISELTNRETFYTHSIEKLTFMICDDQAQPSNFTADQVSMLNTIVDTISPGSNLMLLTHQLMWMRDHPVLHDSADVVANGGIGDLNWQINPNNYYQDIHPLLQSAKEKGVTVLVLSGDLGSKRKFFEFTDNDGIIYLASGMEYGHSDNGAILFRYNKENSCLTWEFKGIDELEYLDPTTLKEQHFCPKHSH